MKKFSFILAALLLTSLLAYSYFSVDGTEIKEIEAVTEHYTATVVKTHETLTGQQTEYTLSPQQISLFKELIQNSRFIRKLSSDFYYKGLKDTYRITLELFDSNGKQRDFLSLYCVEDLYLMIWATAPDSQDYALLIRNPNWHNDLEALLSISN